MVQAMTQTKSSAPMRPFNHELINSLEKMVRPLAYRRGDVDDIVQEVLVKVFKSGHEVEPAKFLAWLHQVSRTTAIDFYRKNKKHAPLEEKHLINLKTQSLEESSETATTQLSKCVRPLLKKLPSDDHRLISEVDLSGASQTEMAEKEGLKYSSLKSKVQRARQKLKDEILACCEVELDRRSTPLNVKSKNKKNSCC